jgi:hypothetical protein
VLFRSIEEVRKKYGSLDAVRQANRRRWAQDAQEAAKGMEAMRWASMEQERLMKLQGSGPRVPPPYVPSEEDTKAQASFQDAMKKAAFDQLSAEGKINTLIGKRQQLMRDIAKVQEGSAQFHEMREQVLGVETEIKGLVNERTEEIRQAAERNVRTPQFTAAVEEGSVEAYRARIGAERKDEVAKNTKLMDDKLKNLVKIGKDNTTLLQEAVAAMTGTVQVVSIV